VDASTKVFGLSIKTTYAEELSFYRSESYEVSRSVSFETGPLEDSVVFTAIPYDFYTYEVVAEMLNATEDIEPDRQLQRMGLPRTPIIRMAEVGYYNDHTTENATKIDAAVFAHTAGDLGSYPNAAERDEILAVRQTQLDEIRLQCPGCWNVDPDAPQVSGLSPIRQFDPLSALPGLVSDEVGVGQGSGSTGVAIDFSQSSGSGAALALSAELEVEVTAGFLVGGCAIGGGVGWSTNTSRGESTSYAGFVGSIDSENFAGEQYRFGMFTYLQGSPESGAEFEVINYWVE
jgi:hypothetical protein